MRPDFCAFILSHGRPDKVFTYDTLIRSGYTGKIFIVIDDEDKTADEYRKKYGDIVIQFCKAEIAKQSDEGDNFGHRKSTLYARNAFWKIAAEKNYKYFIQLDDDYNSGFYLRFNSKLNYGNTQRIAHSLDLILEELIQFLDDSKATCIALSQGGDHIGGQIRPRLSRKVMNSFICNVERPFFFRGHLNEDVNTYVQLGRAGELFFTVMQAQVNQLQTQVNSGGMSDIYLDSGTYVKSFYTVMYAPSCSSVGTLGDPRSPHYRIHHKLNWNNISAKLLRQDYKK